MFQRLLPEALKLDFSRVGPLVMAALGLGVLAVILAYTVGLRWHHQSSILRRLFLLALRLSAVACVVFALLHPTWDRPREEQSKPVLGVLLDNSRSMARPFADQSTGVSRYAKALTVLHEQVQPALGGKYRLKLFDVDAAPLDTAHLPPSPEAASSPILAGLVNVQHELAGEPLTGILLLSDGIETSQRSGAAACEPLRVPVYPIAVAQPRNAPSGPPDLVLQAVATNRTALVGNMVRVTVDVGATGETHSARVPLAILDARGVIVAASTIQWRPEQPLLRTKLDFVPTRPGNFTYTVQLGKLPGETNLDNNRKTFSLTVHAKALKVLYVDGVLRWEGKFIREALTSDPDINVISSVRTAPPGTDRGSQGLLLPEALAKVDMVILGDVEATYFAAQEMDALRTWVTTKGGALLLTGGYNSFGPKGFGGSQLREILPVRFSAGANPQVDQPFPLTLTALGEESPIFDLTGNRLHDTAFYQKLPQLGGCSLIAGVKPGGQVLAVNPLLRDPGSGGPLPVMVLQQVGLGRAMVFAVDTTWRWRTVVGGYTGDASFYQRFWGQIVRWMTGEAKDSPRAMSVWTDRYRYQPGQSVQLNIDLQGPPTNTAESKDAKASAGNSVAAPPTSGPRHWQVTAIATDEEGRQVRLPLAELSARRYQGSFTARSPGRWDVTVEANPEDAGSSAQAELAAPGQPSATKPSAQSRVVTLYVDRPDLESLDTEPRGPWLTRLAQRTGGRCLSAQEVPSLLNDLPGQPLTTIRADSIELWHNPWLAGLFFALVCAEWILRRLKRLA